MFTIWILVFHNVFALSLNAFLVCQDPKIINNVQLPWVNTLAPSPFDWKRFLFCLAYQFDVLCSSILFVRAPLGLSEISSHPYISFPNGRLHWRRHCATCEHGCHKEQNMTEIGSSKKHCISIKGSLHLFHFQMLLVETSISWSSLGCYGNTFCLPPWKASLSNELDHDCDCK